MSTYVDKCRIKSPNIAKYCHLLTNIDKMDKYRQISTNDDTSTNVDKYRQILNNVDKYQQLFIYVDKCRRISPNMDKYRYLSTNIEKYRQIPKFKVIDA